MTVKIRDLKEGTRIHVSAFVDDEADINEPAFDGEVLEVGRDTVIAQMDEKFITDEDDDGIREFTVDQIVSILPPL